MFMMQTKFIALLLLVLPLSNAYMVNKTLPSFAACDEKMISGIRQYWKTVGTPQNVLKKIEEEGQHVVVHTSYDYLNSENKCVFMDASDENKTLAFTFIPKDGSTPAVITYNIKEADDGSIYDDEKNMRWYTTALLQGVEVNYVCSVAGGTQTPPLGSIFVAKKKFNFLTQPIISNFNRFLSGLGINFVYNYGAECFDITTGLTGNGLTLSLPRIGL